MVENTAIEWARHTCNFWTGCAAVGPGCAGCYAETWAKRAGRDFAERRRTTSQNWRKPYKWNAEAARTGEVTRVFTNSLADFFDNQVPHEWRAHALRVMRETPALTWLVLTKRIGNAVRLIEAAADWHFDYGDRDVAGWLTDWYKHGIPPANVWLGATVVNQAEVDRDLPKLLATPAAVRFASCEPLLGWVYLGAHFRHDHHVGDTNTCEVCRLVENPMHAADARGLDWVIVGGESGPKARPFHAEWARTLRAQCSYFGAKVFVKQMGANVWDAIARGHDWPLIAQTTVDDQNDGNCRMKLADRKGGDMNEWPISLRRREFPQ
jgi:protein gp37